MFNSLLLQNGPDSIIDAHEQRQKKLFTNRYKDELLKPEMDKKFGIFRGGVASKINNQFGLGLTRKESESASWEELLTKAGEKHLKDLEAAQSKGDEDLREDVKKYQLVAEDRKQEIEDWKEKYDRDTKELESNYNSKYSGLVVKGLFEKEFKKYKFGLKSIHVPVLLNRIEQEIKERYEIDTEGKIMGKNEAFAEGWDGTTIYTNLSEPIEYLVNKYEMLQKSNGDTDGAKAPKVIQGIYNKSKLDAESNAMHDRIKKARQGR